MDKRTLTAAARMLFSLYDGEGFMLFTADGRYFQAIPLSAYRPDK